MEKMNDLRDLFRHEIQDLYSAEEQILKALPAMIDKANNTSLKNSLSEHLRITEEHRKRLEKVQQMIQDEPADKKEKEGLLSRLFRHNHVCKGMQGIIDEGNKIIGEDMAPEVLDAAIIASAQKVEHYEICGYGTARTYARELGMEQVARLLEQTLNEEYEADDRLTALAVTRINKEAETAGGASGDASASGSTRTTTGRDTTRERVRREQMEMEPVAAPTSGSSRRQSSGTTTGRSSGSTRGGQPRATSTPRSSSSRTGTTGDRKTASSSRTPARTTKTSGRSGRSSSGGRGNSSARGRK